MLEKDFGPNKFEGLEQGSEARLAHIEAARGIADDEILVLDNPQTTLFSKFKESLNNFIEPAGRKFALPASVVLLTIAAACADGESEPTPTPTETWIPRPTSTVTSTETPTPEPAVLIERIDLSIPNLIVEKYAIHFEDVSSQITDMKKAETKAASHRITCNRSFIDQEQIRSDKYETFYYSADYDRYYLLSQNGFAIQSLIFERCFPNDKLQSSDEEFLAGTLYPAVIVITDLTDEKMYLIRDENLRLFDAKITEDGEKILINFFQDKAIKRGTYLINLNNWQILYHADESPYEFFLNEDGSRIYVNGNEYEEYQPWEERGTGYFIDTITGEKTQVRWPSHLTSYSHVASNNLNYIARGLGMFFSNETMEGQWGILVYTPNGFFQISAQNWSILPERIDNDGTIHTDRGEVFKFENATYRLVSTSDDNPLDVDIVRIE